MIEKRPECWGRPVLRVFGEKTEKELVKETEKEQSLGGRIRDCNF